MVTNITKQQLRFQCRKLAELGYTDKEALNKLNWQFPELARTTVKKYWKIFSQQKQEKVKWLNLRT